MLPCPSHFCGHCPLSKENTMAQTLPPSPDSSAPLPRYERKRASAAKAPRPRFQAADAALTALFVAVCAALSAHGRAALPLALFLSALTAGVTFLLGWRCGGRLCGVVAGSLTALSFSFVQASSAPAPALLGLLTVAALLAFACDAALAACILAGFAAAVRPDGALLGLLLIVLIAARTHRLPTLSVGALIAAALVGGSVRIFILHMPVPTATLYGDGANVAWLLRPAQALTIWLLIPLCAELTDTARRVRWLPTALWGLLSLGSAVGIHFAGMYDTGSALMPIVFVLAAGGLARLMPLLAGEIPAARYALATLAIAGLLLLRSYWEWRSPAAAVHPPVAVLAPAINPPVPLPQAVPRPVPVHPVVLPRPVKAVRPLSPALPGAVRSALAGRALVKQPAPKPAVPLYSLRNGHLVHRTKWAIQWDLAHPKAKP